MQKITFKKPTDNSKSRRMRKRGEHYAKVKAMYDLNILILLELDKNIAKLAGEPFGKIKKVISQNVEYRQQINAEADKYKVPEMPAGSICIPEVAIYRAGYRNNRKRATHIIK